jgi:hypothetical protein
MGTANGNFGVSANIQTVVTGPVPAIQLNSVDANASFPTSLDVFSFNKDLSFLGTVSIEEKGR